MATAYKYTVAISFAEEDRNAALALALAMELAGIRNVYYYPDQRLATWGHQLKKKLTSIYSVEAQYAVPLLSANYFKASKVYTKIERQAIKEQMEKDPQKIYMVPVVLDGRALQVNSKLFNAGYLQWEFNPKKIAAMLNELLGEKVEKMKQATVQKVTILGDGNVHAYKSIVNIKSYGQG